MTAAGLVVAIPAVLAYNALGRSVGRMESDLEGFAYDLRELLSSSRIMNATRRRSAPIRARRRRPAHDVWSIERTDQPPMSDMHDLWSMSCWSWWLW